MDIFFLLMQGAGGLFFVLFLFLLFILFTAGSKGVARGWQRRVRQEIKRTAPDDKRLRGDSFKNPVAGVCVVIKSPSPQMLSLSCKAADNILSLCWKQESIPTP